MWQFCELGFGCGETELGRRASAAPGFGLHRLAIENDHGPPIRSPDWQLSMVR